MLRRAMRRVGRVAVGTAVVAGTAGAVSHHQQQKYAAQDQQAYEAQQYEAQQAQGQDYAEPAPQQAAPQVVYAPPPPAAAPAPDMGTQLQNLADLHSSGALTDEEYAAAKAKVISG
ncbi:MAG: SHOCT domain-containing protein [Anaerolineae bacterium]|nr:SHOCT domain-containing protein [Anaerolineae bacterium]